MSNNCFLKKLSTSLDNNELLKRGEIKVADMNTAAVLGGNVYITGVNTGINCRILGYSGAKFSLNNQETISNATGDTLVNTNKETDIAITYANIYKAISNSSYTLDINILKNCVRMYQIQVMSSKGNLASLPTSLKILTLANPNDYSYIHGVQGNIGDIPSGIEQVTIEWYPNIVGNLSGLHSHAQITILYLKETGVEGSAAALVNALPNLTELSINNSPNVGGNVSDLVANNNITKFYVRGTQFVGTASEIKAKLPNATVIAADGTTA